MIGLLADFFKIFEIGKFKLTHYSEIPLNGSPEGPVKDTEITKFH